MDANSRILSAWDEEDHMRKIVLLAVAMALILGSVTVWAGNSESSVVDDAASPVITNAI